MVAPALDIFISFSNFQTFSCIVREAITKIKSLTGIQPRLTNLMENQKQSWTPQSSWSWWLYPLGYMFQSQNFLFESKKFQNYILCSLFTQYITCFWSYLTSSITPLTSYLTKLLKILGGGSRYYLSQIFNYVCMASLRPVFRYIHEKLQPLPLGHPNLLTHLLTSLTNPLHCICVEIYHIT